MTKKELKEFLDAKVEQYNCQSFIAPDPISIPHLFTDKKDIEISGFIIATISWGKREIILKNGKKLMKLMDYAPYQFIKDYNEQKDFRLLEGFKHRTFNAEDLNFFIKSLQHIYSNYEDLEAVFNQFITPKTTSIKSAIEGFHEVFFELNKEPKFRTFKHVSNPKKGSAAKRINMFLRWMVRNDNKGVDFGIWDSIPTSILSCPLDVHSGNVARSFGLLKRKQNDWKALEELDNSLRKLDPKDPVKYDFALFGLGVNEQFK